MRTSQRPLTWLGVLTLTGAFVLPSVHASAATPVESSGRAGLLGKGAVGKVGQTFVTEAVKGLQSQPVRVYVGLSKEKLPPFWHFRERQAAKEALRHERVKAAVNALEKQGGFDKARIVVVPPTGTGMVEANSIDAEEMMSKGNVATVSMQYAAVPSVLALHKLGGAGRDARELVDAIAKRNQELHPAGDGPRLMVFGLSLGAGAAISGLVDRKSGALNPGVDRALFEGAPFFRRVPVAAQPEGLKLHSLGDLAALTPAARGKMHMLEFTHPDDPVAMNHIMIFGLAKFVLKNIFQFRDKKGWGGHNYRGHAAALVQAAFDHPDVSKKQVDAIQARLTSEP